MKLEQEILIDADRDRVFAALNDVGILRQAIPGCEEIDQVSDTEFTATVASKVGPIKAKFKGSVTLSDLDPPASYTMTGQGTGGAAGFAKMRATVHLAEDGDRTIMTYAVKADVGGKLAQLGGRLIDTTAKKMAGEFFGRFEALVSDTKTDGAASTTAETDAPGGPESFSVGTLVWVLGGVLAVALLAYFLTV
ncbi:MAG: carbon monoxide dehydrogenase subunit G [Gammaproteobacteria bacterium]|nr:carbon monoxide dehydrogenase subunit G [Gammaproteobacteria bacterium]HJP35124.1 carbon monoxide dehydrogenase subunit G [Gammaproteobacteria bacterium]